MSIESRCFRRLAGFRRSPPGLEWRILRRLPGVLVIGMGMALALGAAPHWDTVEDPAAAYKAIEMAHAYAAATALTHVAIVLTVALACWIVCLMKGPAYVADGYELPDADSPREAAAARDSDPR
jgi:hypothetical protein